MTAILCACLMIIMIIDHTVIRVEDSIENTLDAYLESLKK